MQMKKTRMLILCLLAALMCVLLAGCGSKEKTDVSGSQYVGTWNAVKITAAGKEVTAEEVFGGGFVLELKNDGTYTMTSGTGMAGARAVANFSSTASLTSSMNIGSLEIPPPMTKRLASMILCRL